MRWYTLQRTFPGALLGGLIGLIFAPACQPCAVVAITLGIVVGGAAGSLLGVFYRRRAERSEPPTQPPSAFGG